MQDLEILYGQEEFHDILSSDQIINLESALGIGKDMETVKTKEFSFDTKTLSYIQEIGEYVEGTKINISSHALSFLDSIVGNKEFNKIAKAYQKSDQKTLDESFASQDTLKDLKSGFEMVLTLSYKLDLEKQEKLATIDKKMSFMLEEISEVISLPKNAKELENFQLDEKQQKFLSNIEIPEEFQLTTRDAGLLKSTEGMWQVQALRDLVEKNSKIGALCDKISDINFKYKVLSALVNQSMPYTCGDISFDNRVIEDKVFGREMTKEQRGQRVLTLTDYDHGATILKTDTGKLEYAHVYGEYCSWEIPLHEFCYQDTYRLDWNAILTKEEKSGLEDVLDSMHKDGIKKDIHSPEQFMQFLYENEYKDLISDVSRMWEGEKNVDNPYDRRKNSVKESVREKVYSTEVDNKDTFDETMKIKESFETQKESFCTEFQSKVTLYCWTAVQKKAVELVKMYNENSTLKVREKPRCMDNQKSINFKSMHAGNVMKLLSKWVKPVPKSNFFKQVVKQSDLEYSPLFV